MKHRLSTVVLFTTVFASQLMLGPDSPVSAQPQDAIRERPNFPRTRVYYLRFAQASEVARVITELYSDLDKTAKIKVIPDPRMNALFISASNEVATEIEKLLKLLDGENPQNRKPRPNQPANEIKVFTLKNANAKETMEVVTKLLGKPIQLTADPRSNSLIATGAKQELEFVEAILLKLDDSHSQRSDILRVYPLKHTTIAKASNTLAQLGVSGNFATDADQKRVILRGNDTDHRMVSELLETIDVPASNPDTPRMQLRIVWLVDETLAGKEAAAPSKNLDKVVKVLDEKLGVKNLKTAAQLLVTVDPGSEGYSFTARGTTKFIDDMSVELQAEGVLSRSGAKPTIELSLHAQELGSRMENPLQGRRSSSFRQLTSLTTKVAAPQGHSIVLGMTPIESADSVFVLQVLSNEDLTSNSK